MKIIGQNETLESALEVRVELVNVGEIDVAFHGRHAELGDLEIGVEENLHVLSPVRCQLRLHSNERVVDEVHESGRDELELVRYETRRPRLTVDANQVYRGGCRRELGVLLEVVESLLEEEEYLRAEVSEIERD